MFVEDEELDDELDDELEEELLDGLDAAGRDGAR